MRISDWSSDVCSSDLLNFTGRVTRPEYAQRVAEFRKDWSLPVGRPFINNDWNRAKSTLLDAVASRDFMLAHMTLSDAAVHADTAEVHLSVTIDSGPLVRMGDRQSVGEGKGVAGRVGAGGGRS